MAFPIEWAPVIVATITGAVTVGATVQLARASAKTQEGFMKECREEFQRLRDADLNILHDQSRISTRVAKVEASVELIKQIKGRSATI